MKININNKVFSGKYDEDGKLIILLTDDDVLFFQQWEYEGRKGIISKKDYVKDFEFINGYEQGTLYNCQPILSKNLDWVNLIYDYNSGKLVLPCS